PRLPGARGECRPDQDVRLDVDHDQVAPFLNRREGVARAGARIASRLDHHVQARRGDQGGAVVGQVGSPGAGGALEVGRVHLLVGPAGVAHEAARALRLEVGYPEHLQPWGEPGLGQEHGAKLAGADQADPDRLAGCGALLEETVQVHGAAPTITAARRFAARPVSRMRDKKKEAVTASPRVMLLEQCRFRLILTIMTTSGFPQSAQGLSRLNYYRSRSTISFFISAIALAGLSPLGQVLAQFRMVWQRYRRNGSSSWSRRSPACSSRESTSHRCAWSSTAGPRNRSGFHQ